MNAKIITLLACLWPAAALAQGFGGLGADVQGFETPKPGGALTFPADHGAHKNFRTEWWYVTANLTGADGASYGAQWTLFRHSLEPGAAAAAGPEAVPDQAAIGSAKAATATIRTVLDMNHSSDDRVSRTRSMVRNSAIRFRTAL